MGLVGEAFRNQLLSHFMIVSREQFEKLSLEFTSAQDPVTGASISFPFTHEDFRLLEPGDFLFKLAVKARVQELYTQLEDMSDSDAQRPQNWDPEKVRTDICKLSVNY